MKVIVQDLETGTYLSPDGQWGASQADARDFFTLLRAYHFAKAHTSRRFQVLLHCPDDQYCTQIIDGKGMAAANHEAVTVPVQVIAKSVKLPTFSRSRNFDALAHRFNWTRNDLN